MISAWISQKLYNYVHLFCSHIRTSYLRAPSCPEILLIWSECPDMDLCYAVATLFASHDYVYVANVVCQVMFLL